METLYVYALLCTVGFDQFSKFEAALNTCFLSDPSNEVLFDLEERSMKDAILHMLHLAEVSSIDTEAFGKTLMDALKPIYRSNPISEFSSKTYALWQTLPSKMDTKEPFHTFSYAGDCLDYGDEEQCRKLYECALDYYEA